MKKNLIVNKYTKKDSAKKEILSNDISNSLIFASD